MVIVSSDKLFFIIFVKKRNKLVQFFTAMEDILIVNAIIFNQLMEFFPHSIDFCFNISFIK